MFQLGLQIVIGLLSWPLLLMSFFPLRVMLIFGVEQFWRSLLKRSKTPGPINLWYYRGIQDRGRRQRFDSVTSSSGLAGLKAGFLEQRLNNWA